MPGIRFQSRTSAETPSPLGGSERTWLTEAARDTSHLQAFQAAFGTSEILGALDPKLNGTEELTGKEEDERKTRQDLTLLHTIQIQLDMLITVGIFLRQE